MADSPTFPIPLPVLCRGIGLDYSDSLGREAGKWIQKSDTDTS